MYPRQPFELHYYAEYDTWMMRAKKSVHLAKEAGGQWLKHFFICVAW